MKRTLAIFIFIAYVFGSCDKIEAPYLEKGVDTSTAVGKVRKVLVEDYTGHTCGNCPRAAEMLDTLKSLYGEKIISFAVHAGTAFSPPQKGPKYMYDFRTDAGTEWDNFFGISKVGNPNGMVNRTGYSQQHIKYHTDWSTAIGAVINTPPDVYITISNKYDAASKSVTSTVTTSFLTSQNGEFKLQVVLTEDSIVKWQKDYSKEPSDIENYVHRHALRGVLNSTWGESIVNGPIDKSVAAIKKSYSITLKDDWNVAKCTVVAFVYNAATYEVLQAEEMKVIE
jgi:hypothetical protein